MIRYLTGVSNPAVKAIAERRSIGLLAQPGNGYAAQAKSWPFWAADNGCYSQGEAFDLGAYLGWLEANQDKACSCLFATAPDVVGDMTKSWARSAPVLERIRALGYPAALVAQNGLHVSGPGGDLEVLGDDRDPASDTGERIPWSSFDVLFIGGDNRFKLSWRQFFLIGEAKARGKRVHVGRVNSYHRLQQAEHFGADTADGTFLAFAGRGKRQAAGVAILERWLDELWTMTTTAPAIGPAVQQTLFT